MDSIAFFAEFPAARNLIIGYYESVEGGYITRAFAADKETKSLLGPINFLSPFPWPTQTQAIGSAQEFAKEYQYEFLDSGEYAYWQG